MNNSVRAQTERATISVREIMQLLSELSQLAMERDASALVELTAHRLQRALGVPTVVVSGPRGTALRGPFEGPGLDSLSSLAGLVPEALVIADLSSPANPLERALRDAGAGSAAVGCAGVGRLGVLVAALSPQAQAFEPTVASILDAVAHGLALAWTERTDASGYRQQALEDIVEAQESDRRRIAQDLHDDQLQVLAAIALRLGMLRRQTPEGPVNDGLENAEREVRAGIVRLRQMMYQLRPGDTDGQSVSKALRDQLDLLGNGSVSTRVSGHLEVEPDEPVRMVIFRISEEAIRNAVRHAGARNISVTVDQRAGNTHVRIVDDGTGFTLDPAQGAGPGTRMMRHRAELAGGRLDIRSQPGHGTVVELILATHTAAEGAQQPPMDSRTHGH